MCDAHANAVSRRWAEIAMKSSTLRAAGPVILVTAALFTMILGLAIGGGAAPRLVNDPGALVRWGLPAAKLVANLSLSVMIGALTLAAFLLRSRDAESARALDTASASAAVFTVASGATGFLTFLSSFNPKLSLGTEFGQQLGRFLIDTELGRVWLITTLAAATITIVTFAARGPRVALSTWALSVAAAIPMATQGHSGSLANHDAAVMALVLHTLGAAVWLGGLVALVIIRPTLPARRLPVIVERYSSFALIAFCIVVTSGVARTIASVSKPGDLISPYGTVLALKVAALLILGAFGAMYRRRFINRSATGGGVFWTFIAVELAVMGIASGAAAALARTPSPADTTAAPLQTAAEILTEAPVPPPLTPMAWLTEWDLDVLWLVIAALTIIGYLGAARRLRRRGETWPRLRTCSWVAGMSLLVWVTSGPIAAYGDYLHSIDMLGRALLLTLVPALLVTAAPYRLAVDALPIRTDGSDGAREWLIRIGDSRPVKALSHPLVAGAVFVLVTAATSTGPGLRWALSDPLGHQTRIVITILAGAILLRSATSTALHRGERRLWMLPYAAALAAVAGIGAWALTDHGLILADWFGAMGRQWGVTPMTDQRIAGAIALAAAAVLLGATLLTANRHRLARARHPASDQPHPNH